jgi:hypothetical protein
VQTATPAAAKPEPARFQQTLDLSGARDLHGWHDVTAFGPDAAHPLTTMRNRCHVVIAVGSATMRLYPTPDEMRALAALLIEAAGGEQ